MDGNGFPLFSNCGLCSAIRELVAQVERWRVMAPPGITLRDEAGVILAGIQVDCSVCKGRGVVLTSRGEILKQLLLGACLEEMDGVTSSMR